MKYFFYSIVGIYLFLYFYAVYAYEGFTLVTAFSVLITFGVLGWLLLRGWSSTPSDKSAGAQAVPVSMSWYQSPFPYILLIMIAAFIGFLLV